MSNSVIASSEVSHCSHCGKNLSHMRKKHQIVDGDAAFCCQSCQDLYAMNHKPSRKGKWSKTRSPFVDLKKVLT